MSVLAVLDPAWTTVIVALIVSIVSPTLLAMLTNHSRRAERQADWDRQDDVAEKAKAAVDAAAARQAEMDKATAVHQSEQADAAARLATELAAHRADEAKVAAAQAAGLRENSAKLDIVHTLVNSNLTTAMQDQLDATVAMLAMMRELVGVNRAAGREPTPETLAAIELTEKKIIELQAKLLDRLSATRLAERQELESAADPDSPGSSA